MLGIKIKNFLYNNRKAIYLAFSLFLYAADAWCADGGTFSSLHTAGEVIKEGLITIIWPAATIGIAAVCIAGMFGNFNWKWFIAILLGVFVIAVIEQVGALATGTTPP